MSIKVNYRLLLLQLKVTLKPRLRTTGVWRYVGGLNAGAQLHLTIGLSPGSTNRYGLLKKFCTLVFQAASVPG